MPEITAAEAAANCERLANDFEEVGTPGNAKILRYAASVLRRAASGELAEVVHAHWIGGYFCKNGQWDYTPPECSNCHNTVTNGVSLYCPNCGALMDEPQK
jgi:hypothetical protein